jgi:hypothetical protein
METMPCQRKRQYRITTPDSSGALNPTTEWIASHLSFTNSFVESMYRTKNKNKKYALHCKKDAI